MNSFEDKIKQAQDIAEIYLKLTDQQQEKIYDEMLSMKFKNESSSNPHAYAELEEFAKFIKSLSDDQKLEVLDRIKKLREKDRKDSNVSIDLKLGLK